MKNELKIKLHENSVRRILIGVFCAFIGICMAMVMFFAYDPSQNSSGAVSSLSMDIICVIILFILIGSFAFGDYVTNKTTWVFSALIVATIWALFLDFLNWAFDGELAFGQMTFWYTVGSLCMGSILACIFSLYLYRYMEETHSFTKMRKISYVCATINLVSFVLTFVLALTGTAFKFVEGHYETGVLYDFVTALPILTLLCMTGYVIFHIKTIGLHDVLAVAGYIGFMIAGALIEAENSIGTTYVSVAIADIYIFVMLQNEIIAKEKRNVQEWMIRSNTDELTGFYNRHAYETDIDNLESNRDMISDDFVFVSADVNSLKAVNDSHGHNAGDELLIGASQCLDKCFGAYGKLYRIGGDEFIVIIHANEDDLRKMQNDLNELTQKWSGKYVQTLTLSCGYVTGKESEGMSVRQMASLADRRMYEAKGEYYRQAGIERRKQ